MRRPGPSLNLNVSDEAIAHFKALVGDQKRVRLIATNTRPMAYEFTTEANSGEVYAQTVVGGVTFVTDDDNYTFINNASINYYGLTIWDQYSRQNYPIQYVLSSSSTSYR